MAATAHEGAVYRIDEQRGKPPHFWIVLNEPEATGEFLIVAFTDAERIPRKSMTWPTGWRVCDGFALTKPSALHVRFARLVAQDWLDELTAEYRGQATPAILREARCVFCYEEDVLQPILWSIYSANKEAWYAPCAD